jgi:hypothetical protein
VSEQLWELYRTVCQDEMRPLGEFIDRLLAREWGAFPREEILDLLREIEGQMLSNIQIKTMEGSRFAEMADEVSEETQKQFEALIDRVEQAFAGEGGPP